MTNSAPKADGINKNEALGVAHTDGGVLPRFFNIKPDPIRKRAFHRALKRGESWAVYRKSMQSITDVLARKMFSQTIYNEPKLAGFLKGLKKDD